MSAKVKVSNKPAAVNLYFQVMNEAGEHLNSQTGMFETWTLAQSEFYDTPLIEIANSNGVFVGTVPAINASYLPASVSIHAFDPLTVVNGPFAQGGMRIDKLNNEQPNDLLLYNIFAATVYNNLGVDTLEEKYYGHDDWLAFTSEFNTLNGNRQVTVEGL